MRALITLDEIQIRKLDRLAKAEKQSRAALIREAIDAFLERKQQAVEDDAFGLWGKRKIDGLEYQEKVRSEW